MSVIVKGMRMPKTCIDCRFCHCNDITSWYCMCLSKDVSDIFVNNRDDCCPLVEIPDDHSRIIDADTLANMLAVDPFECPGCPEPEGLEDLYNLIDCAEVILAEEDES